MTTPWWDRVEGAGEEPRKRRSTYEDHDLVVASGDDDTDPDEVEPGWTRIGELDPRTGAWLGGRPRWPGA